MAGPHSCRVRCAGAVTTAPRCACESMPPELHFHTSPGSVPPRPADRPGYRSRPRAHAASTSPPLPGGRGTRRCSGTRPGRIRIGGPGIRQRPVLRQDLLQAGNAGLVDIHPEGRQELLISHAVTPFQLWTQKNDKCYHEADRRSHLYRQLTTEQLNWVLVSWIEKYKHKQLAITPEINI